ncbi:MAG: type IV pilus assembly protein PilM [Candidatus Omnitrophota bacterium]|jgi:type IV pilus assembly protein PilM
MADNKAARVGLDIGTDAVKIVAASSAADKTTLIALGMKDIRGVSRQELPEVIKQLAATAKISQKDVNISISGSSVIARFITMPKMDKEALKGAIRFEAEKFIPFDINDCMVDFQVMERDKAENKLNILLVAAKKEVVLEKIKIAEAAGFSVRLVDVDGFALANSFFKNFPALEPDKACALLNIGATFTNLCILKGGSLYFSRDVALGTNEFSTSIAKKLNVDRKAADELSVSAGPKAAEVTDCMKTVFGNLLEEVKLSFNYYENQGGKNIDEVYISGGGGSLLSIAEVFAESLGSKPSIWKPLEFMGKPAAGIDGELLAHESFFAIAAGLALR